MPTSRQFQDGFKDYIAVPKPICQSTLHDCFISMMGHYLKCKFGTLEMDQVAEFGLQHTGLIKKIRPIQRERTI